MDAPEYQQRVLGFVVLAMYNSGRPALVGQIQWHCRPNLAHVPEFDTYALWQIILPTFFGVKNYFISSPFFLLLFIDCICFGMLWMWRNLLHLLTSLSFLSFFSFFFPKQISAVRAVVPNKSNNEIVLVLQHFENSVDKAVQAFLEGVTTSVTHFRVRKWVFKAFLLITAYHKTGNVAYCLKQE